MNKRQSIRLLLLFITVIYSSAAISQTVLKNGSYKFQIERDDLQTIDFMTQVKDSAGKKIMYIINGADQMLVDSIVTQNDSVFFELPFFESGFAAKIQSNGNLAGVWIKKAGNVVRELPFRAIYGESKRFESIAPPAYNLSGMWTTVFKNKENKESDAIGQFDQ